MGIERVPAAAPSCPHCGAIDLRCAEEAFDGGVFCTVTNKEILQNSHVIDSLLYSAGRLLIEAQNRALHEDVPPTVHRAISRTQSIVNVLSHCLKHPRRLAELNGALDAALALLYPEFTPYLGGPDDLAAKVPRT